MDFHLLSQHWARGVSWCGAVRVQRLWSPRTDCGAGVLSGWLLFSSFWLFALWLMNEWIWRICFYEKKWYNLFWPSPILWAARVTCISASWLDSPNSGIVILVEMTHGTRKNNMTCWHFHVVRRLMRWVLVDSMIQWLGAQNKLIVSEGQKACPQAIVYKAILPPYSLCRDPAQTHR